MCFFLLQSDFIWESWQGQEIFRVLSVFCTIPRWEDDDFVGDVSVCLFVCLFVYRVHKVCYSTRLKLLLVNRNPQLITEYFVQVVNFLGTSRTMVTVQMDCSLIGSRLVQWNSFLVESIIHCHLFWEGLGIQELSKWIKKVHTPSPRVYMYGGSP